MGLFDGKVVVVTGAGGGLGRAYAHAFAAEGAQVVVNDLGGSRDGMGSGHNLADTVVGEIEAAGGEAVANYDSVATREGAEGMIKTAVDAFGRVDVLVNNAGILRDKTLAKMTDAMFDAVIAVHLKGTWLCSQAAARVMEQQGEGGRIISTSSIAGLKGNFGQTNYAAAKAGIAGFTRAAALELGRKGITVNAIAPVAKTRMTDDISVVPDEAKPELVAPMALFLASEMGSGINGQIFGVHGNHIFEYLMELTDGVDKGDEPWTPAEIAERLDAITESAASKVKRKMKEAPAPGAVSPAQKAMAVFNAMTTALKTEKIEGWEANLHFDIADVGVVALKVKGGDMSVVKGAEGQPTCVVKMDAETFFGMTSGEIDGQQAFMQGKISATNMGDLMKYSTAFRAKDAQAAVKAALAELGGGAARDEAPDAGAAQQEEPKGLNFDKVGATYVAPAYFVKPAQTMGYAKATNDHNARYLDEGRDGGLVAPPMFVVRLFHDLQWACLSDEDLRADLAMLLFGEQDLRFHDLIRPGDLLARRGHIVDIVEKGSGDVISFVQQAHRGDQLVAEGTSSFFVRRRGGGKRGGSKKAKAEPPALPELAFSDDMLVREDQTYDYAEVSADRNPIHLDDDMAKAAGLPGIILHGLCTMAFASQAFVKQAADGDPSLLKRLKVRFAKPVFPGNTITTQAWIDDDGAELRTYGFQMVNQDGVVVVTSGVAEVKKRR